MSFENPSTNEKEPVSLTREQMNKLTQGETDDPELISLMQEKGIDFDNGFIDVDIDGEKRQMNSSKEDFGTLKD